MADAHAVYFFSRAQRTRTACAFHRDDYATFPVRLIVELIDFAVFATVTIGAFALGFIVMDDAAYDGTNLFCLIAATVAFLYFVVLKRSRFRTLGYRVGRVRIVALDGSTPGYWPLFVRMLFGLLGPLYWLVDLGWASSDPHRQTLRDKFAETYVVKLNAVPAGQALVASRHCFVCGLSLLFREVETPGPAPDIR